MLHKSTQFQTPTGQLGLLGWGKKVPKQPMADAKEAIADTGLRQTLQETLAQVQPPPMIRDRLLRQAISSSR